MREHSFTAFRMRGFSCSTFFRKKVNAITKVCESALTFSLIRERGDSSSTAIVDSMSVSVCKILSQLVERFFAMMFVRSPFHDISGLFFVFLRYP
jgi:hypothetical protein